MRKAIPILFCVLFFILDNALMPFISIKGTYGSLLFTFIISYSIINDYRESAAIGIFSGLLQDLYLFNGIGTNAFTNMLLCLLACKIGKSIFKEKRLIPVLSTLLLNVMKGLMVFAIFFILGIKMELTSIVISSLYSMVISIFMYKKIYKLYQKPWMKKEWNF